MVSALTAIRKTMLMYPNGMNAKQIEDLITEIDQQLGIRNTELELLKRA